MRKSFLRLSVCLLATNIFAAASSQAVAGNGWGDQFDTYTTSIPQVASYVPVLSESALNYTEAAVRKYQQIVQSGGWPHVPVIQGAMRLGAVDPAVKALRQRLFISGDLPAEAGMSNAFDSYVDAAVRRFQKRHGLPANGIVSTKVYRALNVTAEQRLSQLQTNVKRLRKMVPITSNEKRFLMVNIPAAQNEAVEDNKVAQRYTAVVGRVDRRTPILNSKIHQIILNPYWTVPASIIRKDIIPIMQKNPNYLKDNNFHLFDYKGREVAPESIDWYSDEATRLRFRQDPGKINAMSSTKINFYNKYAVYMHDTPTQGTFNDLMRFDSSGCIRVQNISDLNVWLLKGTPGWDRTRMENVIRSRKNTPISLRSPVPVHFVYISAWATGADVVQFRDDIYHMDGIKELSIGD